MKAARIHGYGGPSAVIVEEVDKPGVGPGEVLVKVAAAAVNPVDWKLREGYLRQQLQLGFPFTLGCDLSGVVAEVGEGVVDWRIGDAVYGYPHLLRCGAFAEYACMLEGELAPAPIGLDLAEAAALPVASITAWDGLFTHGALQPGERVLVLGGAGGVGSAAVQMAVAAGAEVWATTSRRNFDFVGALGARPIDYQNQKVADIVAPVDLLFDSVGIEAGMAAIDSLKPGGRYVTSVYGLPPAEILRERHLKTAVYGIQPSGERLRTINAIVERGALRLSVEREFPLREARAALEASQAGRTRGKLLLRP
jgi:NADPH:quinone reductase-like Zn-dependent oxidoreductase